MTPVAWSEPRLLSQRDARTLAALAEVLVPLDAEDVPLGRVDLVARIERLLEGENRVFLRMTRLALWMLEYSPPFCGEGIARFSRLAADGRQRCVAWWETRPSWRLRNIYYLCKITVLSHYYDDEAVAAAVGYRP